MVNITGPVAMTLLEKNNVRYLLIADRHDAYNKNGCDKESLMLHEYLDNLFRSKDQWDFYIEQGSYGIERGEEDKEFAKFLSEAKKEFTAKQLQIYLNKYKKSIEEQADMLEITYNYYRQNGCFFTKKGGLCDRSYKNVRFHFIDVRQANFGTNCILPAYIEYQHIGVAAKILYEGLYQVIVKVEWESMDELREILTKYCDTYFDNVKNVLECLSEHKLMKQIDKSIFSKELNEYFSPPLRILGVILSSILVKMKPQVGEIVNAVLIVVDYLNGKDNADEELARIIFKEFPQKFGEKIFGKDQWENMNEMIQSSSYFRFANSKGSEDKLELIPTQMVFEGEKLIMDLYALSRMTKTYNKNVVVLAGHNHYNNYLHFFQFVKSSILWTGESLSEKCIKVPEWTPRKNRLFGLIGGKTRRQRNTKKRKGRGNKTRKAKKQFLYNPKNPKKSFDVYIDKNPKDTINIKYKTKQDIKNTIRKLERLYKEDKYSHKRIWQVGMIMKVRLEAMYKYRHTRYKRAKNIPSRFKLAKKYFEFLGKRSEEKDDDLRKEMVFKF